MQDFIEYHQDITYLVSTLKKLLKVINHSDPSAARLKFTLHDKYKRRLTQVAADLKRYYHWNEVNGFLLRFTDQKTKEESPRSRKAIKNKLIKDFEAEFVTKLDLTELKPPDQTEIRKRRRARQLVKEVRKQREQEERYTKEKIMEMVRDTKKQRKASSELQRIIDAINKIGPGKIENKINEFFPTKSKQ